MAKTLETINVGIVGHIDHGKTTLLQKLSGKWTDTHSEELKRGITIKLGYADAVISEDKGKYSISGKGEEKRHVSFIDAPGHEMLMATMLSGAAMVDAAILVVAANEGIKPQTREHLMALESKKVKELIVVQNKIDLVDKEQAKKNYDEIKKFLGKKWDGTQVIPVSAQQEVNLEEVWKALVEFEIPKRDDKAAPIFVVARSFDINKPGTKPTKLKGTVLGGTLKQGTLKVGDEVELKPGRKVKEANQVNYKAVKTKIRGLFRGSDKVDELSPGGSMSVETELDMALGKGDSLGGNTLAKAGTLPEITKEVKLRFELFPEVYGLGKEKGERPENVKPGEMLMLSIGTNITGGKVAKVKKDEIEMNLKVPIVPFEGDNVGIARNIGNHWRLIGFGEII